MSASRQIEVLLLALAFGGCEDRGRELEPIDVTVPDLEFPDLSGCVEGPTQPSSAGPQVRFVNMNVDRRLVQVRAGDTVTWTNADTLIHTATAGTPEAVLAEAQGGFDSGDLAPGAQWAYRFCGPRQTVYFCSTHPSQMRDYLLVVTP